MTTWTTRAETDADIPAIRDIILRAFPTAAEADPSTPSGLTRPRGSTGCR